MPLCLLLRAKAVVGRRPHRRTPSKDATPPCYLSGGALKSSACGTGSGHALVSSADHELLAGRGDLSGRKGRTILHFAFRNGNSNCALGAALKYRVRGTPGQPGLGSVLLQNLLITLAPAAVLCEPKKQKKAKKQKCQKTPRWGRIGRSAISFFSGRARTRARTCTYTHARTHAHNPKKVAKRNSPRRAR